MREQKPLNVTESYLYHPSEYGAVKSQKATAKATQIIDKEIVIQKVACRWIDAIFISPVNVDTSPSMMSNPHRANTALSAAGAALKAK